LFCIPGGWFPAGCGYRHNISYLLDICLRLDFVAVDTLFLAWSSLKGIGIFVFSALMMLGSEVVLL
jgi:hypothetical protein